MIVRAAPREHFGWLEERASCVVSEGFRAIEAVDAQGRIHGMLGYDAWTPNAVTISIALEHPAAYRHLMHAAFEYPFQQQGRSVVYAYVVATNSRSVRLVEHVGFSFQYALRDGWAPGVDVLLYEMRKEDCRWLRRGAI